MNEKPYIVFLPTYTATAWYHGRLGPELRGRDLESVLDEARDFAIGEYSTALHKGNLYYEAGHMMYILEEELEKFKADVASFIRSALPGPP